MRFINPKALMRALGPTSLVLALLAGSMSFATTAVAGVVENTACVTEQPAYTQNGINCTAGDLGLSSPVVTVIEPCDFPGDTALLNVTVDITTTATSRYDMGLWFAVDGDPNGDGAYTGTCTVTTIPNTLFDADGNSVNVDNDFCGDVVSTTAGPPDILAADLGTFSLLCEDTNGDGKIDVPLVVAYDNQSDPANCASPVESVPSGKSKCSVSLDTTIDVPVPAEVIVRKTTVPDTDNTVFNFNLSGPIPADIPPGGFDGSEDFTLSHGQTFLSGSLTGGLPAGNGYSVTETPDGNYQSSGICSSNVDGTNTDPSNLNLRAGEIVTCDFTNTANGTVAIVKRTLNAPLANGSPVEQFFFTSPDLPDFSITPLDDGTGNGTGSVNTSGLSAGQYVITETPIAGWDLTNLSCEGGNTSVDLNAGQVTINLVGGETITCTFVNTERGQISIVKDTSPVSTDTFTFTHDAIGGTVPSSPFNLDAGSAENFLDVIPGTILVQEADPTPAYDLGTINCVDSIQTGTGSTSSVATRTATINLDPGETVTCTFTNNLRGSLTVVKQVTGLGPADLGFDFTSATLPSAAFTLTPTNVGVPGQATTTFSNLVPDDYDVAETDPSPEGWQLVSATCDDPGNTDLLTPPGTVPVGIGADVTCTFVNTPLTVPLTLRKEWVGGVATDTAQLTANGTNGPVVATSTANGGDEIDDTNTAVLTAVVGETVTMSEVLGGAGTYSSSFACTGAANTPNDLNATTSTLVIDPADTAITCTFTNSIQTAQLTLQKAWVGGVAADTAQLTASGTLGSPMATSTATGGDETDTTNTAVLTVLAGETVTLSEVLGGTGQYNSSFNCSGAANSPTYTPGDTSATLEIDAADTDITCTFTNSVQAAGLTLQKVWVGGVANDTAQLTITGTGGPNSATSTATGGDQTDLVNVATLPGALAGETYTLSEVLGGTGDYTTSFSCTGNTNAPTYTPGDTSATLLLDSADTSVTCTFTNTVNTAQVTLQKAWVGGVANDTAELDATGANGTQMATSVASGGDETDTTNTAVLTALVGETVTLSEVLGGTGQYTADFNCTGAANAPTYNAGDTSATLQIDGADTAITCTYTNSIQTAQLTLQKAWVGGVAGDTANLNATGSLGVENALSTASGGDETDTTNTVVLTALVGETVTLSETLGGVGVYASNFACTGAANAPTYTAGDTSATLEIDPADSDITCTYTNSIQTARLTLQKDWVNAVAGDTAELTASGNNGSPMATSTASGGDETDTTNTAVLTALVGETVTLSEVLGGTGVYGTGFACTGAANAPTYTAGATSATLEIDPADTAITCTFTNSVETARLTLQKTWAGGVAGDTAELTASGTNGSPMATSTASGGDETDATNTAVLTVLLGETVTLSEVLGGTGAYTTGFGCTGAVNAPTYTPGDTTATLEINSADVAITCTYTNTALEPSVLLEKTGTLDDGGDGVADAGDVINYVFTVTNTGDVDLTNLEVTDSNPDVTIVGSPIASLGAGDSDSSVTGSYVLTQTDIDNGSFTNTATVTSDEGASDDDDDIQTFRRPASPPAVIPVDNPLALILLSLLLLGMGWQMRPARLRR